MTEHNPYAPPSAGPPRLTWYRPPAGAGRPPVARAPEGAPYHRLARTPLHRWWRPLAASLVALGLWLGGGALLYLVGSVANRLAGAGPVPDGQVFSNPVLELAGTLAMLALGIPAVLSAARWPQRRAPGTVLSVTGRMRWRWLAACFGLGTLAIIGVLAVVVLLSMGNGAEGEDLGLGWVGWVRFIGPAVTLLVLVPLQAAGEELVFRGWILQLFGAYLRAPYAGIVIGALLFSTAHGLGTGWGFADLVLFGVVGGWLAVRTGGLEAPIALHAVNNLTVFLLAAAAGQLDDNSTAADAPWQLLVADMVVLPLYALLVVAAARRMAVATRVPAQGRPDETWGRAPEDAAPGPGER